MRTAAWIAGGLALDLLLKWSLATPAWGMHSRSLSWALVGFLVVPGLCAALAYPMFRTGTALVIVGTLGNLLCWIPDRQVENPFVVTFKSGDHVAFNLADVLLYLGAFCIVVRLPAAALSFAEWLRVRLA